MCQYLFDPGGKHGFIKLVGIVLQLSLEVDGLPVSSDVPVLDLVFPGLQG